MLAHPVAVPPDVHDVAVVDQPIDERAGHDVVAEDLAPFVEALVGGEDRGAGFVAPAHELEEMHGAGAADWEVADLVDHEQAWEDERLEALQEVPGLLGFFQRGDEVGECPVVDPAAALGGGNRQADREDASMSVKRAWGSPRASGRADARGSALSTA